MRPLLVVRPQPLGRHLPHLIEIVEEVGVEDLAAVRPVESFDVGVLVRLAGLDVTDLDLVFLAPVDEKLAQELRAIVPTES